MKRVIVILCTLLIANAIQAQMSLGIIAGVNICDEVTTFKAPASSSHDMSSLKGLVIGPTVEMMIPKIDLGIELSTFYSRKGSNFNYILDNTNKSYALLLEGYKTLDYLEVPLYVKWKFGPYGFKMFVAAGCFWGFGLEGVVGVEKAENLLVNNEPIPGLIKTTTMKFGREKEDPYNLIDMGYTFGVGVEIVQTLQLGLYYSYGTTSVVNEKSIKDLVPEDVYGYDDGDFGISSHNSVVSVRLTYLFSGGN